MSEAKSFRQLAGIPPSTASTKDSVLVIIDAQNEYANGYLAVTNTATSRPAIEALLNKYRAGGGHIVHVVHQVSGSGGAEVRRCGIPKPMPRLWSPRCSAPATAALPQVPTSRS